MEKLITKICKEKPDSGGIALSGLLVENKLAVCTDTKRLLIADSTLKDGWYELGKTKKEQPGRFPHYKRCVPDKVEYSFLINVKEFKQAIRSALVMSKRNSTNSKRGETCKNAIKITLAENTLTVFSRWEENNTEVTLDIVPVNLHEWEKLPTERLINAAYIKDYLDHLPEKMQVLVEFCPNNTNVFSFPGSKYILMGLSA